MKIIAVVLLSIGLTACQTGQSSMTMQMLRTHTGAGEICKPTHGWLECDNRTPSAANGGGE